MKKCCFCKEVKFNFEFPKNKSRKNDLADNCRKCVHIYYINNKEKIKNYQKIYNKKNKIWINKKKKNI